MTTDELLRMMAKAMHDAYPWCSADARRKIIEANAAYKTYESRQREREADKQNVAQVTDEVMRVARDAFKECNETDQHLGRCLRAALEAVFPLLAKSEPGAMGMVPRDVAIKLLAMREAFAERDYDEAYHQLYMIASPVPDPSIEPWAELERIAASPQPTTRPGSLDDLRRERGGTREPSAGWDWDYAWNEMAANTSVLASRCVHDVLEDLRKRARELAQQGKAPAV